jgi:hypothetical protein
MDQEQDGRDGRRSPWLWAGVAVFVVAMGLQGLSRIFPFDPDGWLGHWYVQLAIATTAVSAFLGGAHLIGRGSGRRMDVDLPE